MKTFRCLLWEVIILALIGLAGAGNITFGEKEATKPSAYYSENWHDVINRPHCSDDFYPLTLKITPERLKRTIDEYFTTESIIKEKLYQGVDYYEWFDEFDNKYLEQYKLDLKYDATDSLLKLYWKNEF
ncbi:MAG: hypothetical protein ABH952_04805 [Candidatus Omnitrophota bacterium]